MSEDAPMAAAKPEAKEVRKRLDSLLTTAENTFRNQADLKFPDELLEIPAVILKAVPHSGLEPSLEPPFWRFVESLDKDKPWLQIAKRLGRLVKNASRLQQGPFVRLISDYRSGKLPESVKPLLIELDLYIYRAKENLDGKVIKPSERWRPLPDDLTCFIPLLEKTSSRTFAELFGPHDPSALPPAAKAWAYIAFLDLAWQVRVWNERYFEPLEGLAKLLAELHNEEFDEILRRLIYSPGPTVEAFVAYCKRRKNALAKQSSRKKPDRASRVFKRPRPDISSLLEGTLLQRSK